MKTIPKDPNAVLDYQFNWSDWLVDGDTINTYTIIAGNGITVDQSSATPTAVRVWLSGGDNYARYLVTCRVTTTQGRTDDRSILVDCYHR